MKIAIVHVVLVVLVTIDVLAEAGPFKHGVPISPRSRDWQGRLTDCFMEYDDTSAVQECMQTRSDNRCFKWTNVRDCLVENNEFFPPQQGNDATQRGWGGKWKDGKHGMENGMGPQRQRMHQVLKNCTDDYVDCARDKVRQDIQDLPSCANETLRSLAQCAAENADICRESCQNARNRTMEYRLPSRNGIGSDEIRTCSGMRRNLHRPLCRRTNCCEPCFEALQDVANCFLDEVLAVMPNDRPCEMNCPNALANNDTERMLWGDEINTPDNVWYDSDLNSDKAFPTHDSREYQYRFLQDDASNEEVVEVDKVIYETCIQLAPGLNPNERDTQELVDNLDFFDCVVDEMYTVIEADIPDGQMNDGDPMHDPSASPALWHGSVGAMWWTLSYLVHMLA